MTKNMKELKGRGYISVPLTTSYMAAWLPKLGGGRLDYALDSYSNKTINELHRLEGVHKDVTRARLQFKDDEAFGTGSLSQAGDLATKSKEVLDQLPEKSKGLINREEATAVLTYATAVKGTWQQGGVFRKKELGINTLWLTNLGLAATAYGIEGHTRIDRAKPGAPIVVSNPGEIYELKDLNDDNTYDRLRSPYLAYSDEYQIKKSFGKFRISRNDAKDELLVHPHYWKTIFLPAAHRLLDDAQPLTAHTVYALIPFLTDKDITEKFVARLANPARPTRETFEVQQLALASIRKHAFKDRLEDLARIEKVIGKTNIETVAQTNWRRVVMSVLLFVAGVTAVVTKAANALVNMFDSSKPKAENVTVKQPKKNQIMPEPAKPRNTVAFKASNPQRNCFYSPVKPSPMAPQQNLEQEALRPAGP